MMMNMPGGAREETLIHIPLPRVFEEAAALWRVLAISGEGGSPHDAGAPTAAEVHAIRLLQAAAACHRAVAVSDPAPLHAHATGTLLVPGLGDADGHHDQGDDGLTPRERDVLRLLVEGHSDAEIADALCIAPRTVSWHVGHILAKLNVESRTAAATVAIRRSLL